MINYPKVGQLRLIIPKWDSFSFCACLILSNNKVYFYYFAVLHIHESGMTNGVRVCVCMYIHVYSNQKR